MRKKISIIGAGQVGSSFALNALAAELGDIVLIDIDGGLAQGKALDLSQAAAISGKNVRVSGGRDYELIKNSDLVVMTAGLARRPGMSREDLLKKNAEIVTEVAGKIKDFSRGAFILVVTNPLDIMAYLAWKITGWPKNKIFGMAGVLDGGRFKAFLVEELKADPKDIETVVLGIHGDAMMPLPRLTTYKGLPITEILPAEKVAAIVDRTKNGGAEIVKLLKTGSAYYAPGQAIFEMAAAVLKGQTREMLASVLLEGEYGISGVFLGVPVILGAGGVEKIIKLPLAAEELKALETSAASLKENIKILGL